MTGKKSIRLKGGYWRKAAIDSLCQGTGTQPLQTYIDKRGATVTKWVASQPIFEVCVKEMGYEGRGRHREPWWGQAAAEN